MFSKLNGPVGSTFGAANTATGTLPVITSPSFLVAGTTNNIYPTTTFLATGATPITWSISSGTLPAGMTFSSGGVLSGTPTATINGLITFRATNAFGYDERTLTLTITSGVVVANTIVVNNDSASTLTNYPLQIGRAFRLGEIPTGQNPVFVDGVTTLTTQTDVKNRWPDGSIKFAIMSAVIPSISASTRKTLTITPSATPSTPGITVAQFLSDNPDFDVNLNLTGGVTASVSARAMMVAGAVTNWCSGPVMTSWIVVDHLGKTFDVGSDANKSIRPIFHVQKWAGQDTYRVRFITEISDITKLQGQTYALQVTSGVASPVQLLQTASFTHLLGARLSREFWIGTNKPVATVGIGHNVGYLASTKAIPNYDSSITMSTSGVNNFIQGWTSAAKGPFEKGFWEKAMPAAGGRPDIGMFPSWHTTMLYLDNSTVQQIVRNNTDLAGSWMMHWRIGTNRTFDDVTGANGNGKFVTRDSNPTQFLYQGNGYMNTYYVSAQDKFNILTPTWVDGGWIHDGAHLPDPWYLTYLMTGDFWYLEQLQFWASSLLFYPNPGASSSPKDVVINDSQIRARAWILRTRARAAWASVDNSPEKAYLTRATEQALRAMEGEFIGPGGTSALRAWWATNIFAAKPTPNPLRFYEVGDSSPASIQTIPKPPGTVGSVGSTWMDAMLLQIFGHTTELGFGAQELLSWVAPQWIAFTTTPGVDPRHMADYRTPITDGNNAYFQTWTAAYSDYINWTSSWESNLADLEHGYSIFVTAAISFVKNESGGAAAWAWTNTNGYQVANWTQNPKMAIIPR